MTFTERTLNGRREWYTDHLGFRVIVTEQPHMKGVEYVVRLERAPSAEPYVRVGSRDVAIPLIFDRKHYTDLEWAQREGLSLAVAMRWHFREVA